MQVWRTSKYIDQSPSLNLSTHGTNSPSQTKIMEEIWQLDNINITSKRIKWRRLITSTTLTT